MKKLIATTVLLLLMPGLASAEDVDSPVQGQGFFFIGPIFSGPSSVVVHPGGVNIGFGGEVITRDGLGVGAEVGYANGNNHVSLGMGAIGMSYHVLSQQDRRNIDPFGICGYSIYFGQRSTENGWNLGGGVNYWVAKHIAVRFEIRDYAHIRNEFLGARNFVAFRIGATFR